MPKSCLPDNCFPNLTSSYNSGFDNDDDDDSDWNDSKKKSKCSSDASVVSAANSLSSNLRQSMMREQKNRNVHEFYDVLQVLGLGSMGSVSKVRKKSSKIGGSARKKKRKGLSIFNLSMSNIGTPAFVPSIDATQSSEFLTSESSISSGMKPYEIIYALKSIRLNRITDATFRAEMLNEIDILRGLDHPNIVRPIETFEHGKNLFITMELCSGGDLYTRDPYTEEDAAMITTKILSAVAYMHRFGIIHRDLKYENIMFANTNEKAELKIIDFGLSKKYLPEEDLSEGVGTIYTMAPQVLEGSYDNRSDIWSVGVLCFMLLSSQMPFYGKRRRHVIEKIMNCKYDFRGKRWELVSDDAKAFVISFLQFNPDERPTAAEAITSPWLVETVNGSKYKRTFAAMNEVVASIEMFASYSKLKKLALMVIAHKSTSEEIGFLRAAFDQYDSENNGTISFKEFELVMSKFGFSAEELKTLFENVNLDGSGHIHYTEFISATLETHGLLEEERLAEAFDRLDSDDSGFICEKNLRGILHDGFLGLKLTDESIIAIIDEVDITKNQKISYSEFLSMFELRPEEERAYALARLAAKRKQTMEQIVVKSGTSDLARVDAEVASSLNLSSRSVLDDVTFVELEKKLVHRISSRLSLDGMTDGSPEDEGLTFSVRQSMGGSTRSLLDMSIMENSDEDSEAVETK